MSAPAWERPRDSRGRFIKRRPDDPEVACYSYTWQWDWEHDDVPVTVGPQRVRSVPTALWIALFLASAWFLSALIWVVLR